MADIKKRIEDEISNNKIMLYVKGDKGAPMCGFSKTVMDVFNDLGVYYETRNVLEDAELRDGIKAFTQWPTIPQIFIDGKFIGGCDIVRDLYQSGELAPMVKSTQAK